MPRPKGAGPKHPRLGRVLESLIADVERDCSDADIARLVGKIKRLTERGVTKAMKKGGLAHVGEVIPPEGLVAVQVSSMAAKALETLEVIQGRRVERAMKVAALYDLLHGADDAPDGQRPTEIVVRYAKGVGPDSDAD